MTVIAATNISLRQTRNHAVYTSGMRLADLEDAGQIITKEHFDMRLKAELSTLELRIVQQIVASERATRGMIFGSYALIIAAMLANHFWR